MFSTTMSGAVHGVIGKLLQVEVDAASGMPCLEMVGLPGSEVKEARERVRVALKNVGATLPPKHITVNLSPANMRKAGTAYDLPIAIGILKALEVLAPECTNQFILLGELGLDGAVKPVCGCFPVLLEARKQGFCKCLIAKGNEEEAKLIDGMQIYGINHISQAIALLQGKNWESVRYRGPESSESQKTNQSHAGSQPQESKESTDTIDFAHIYGQAGAKRAAEIAAAGGHNLLLIGPPGAGKSMLAGAIPSILPPMTREERLEVIGIASINGSFQQGKGNSHKRPFVSLHHTATDHALIGGGAVPRPGAVTLAHRGVLFLDELPEFKRNVLDALRQPLEEGHICMLRQNGLYDFPSQILLVAAMNPCPCGFYPDQNRCSCSTHQVKQYLGHVSGPILDRMELFAEVLPTATAKLLALPEEESSATMQKRVMEARKRQQERYQKLSITCNSELSSKQAVTYCMTNKEGEALLQLLDKSNPLSARGYYSLMKVARTIADLAGEDIILPAHIAEAGTYRFGCEKYFKGE